MGPRKKAAPLHPVNSLIMLTPKRHRATKAALPSRDEVAVGPIRLLGMIVTASWDNDNYMNLLVSVA